MIELRTRPGGDWIERWWYCLGSDAHVQVAGGSEELADTVIGEVERLEQVWSRFRDGSELHQLNADPSPTVAVSRTLAEALRRAVLAWQLTDGWFDPTVLDSLESAGYPSTFPSDRRARGDLRTCHPAPGLHGVRVDLDELVMHRPPGVRFDLGGIGKGLAADMVAVWLLDRGATSVCIGLGGDIRVAGTTPEGGWHIPVADPRLTDAGTNGGDTSSASTWFEAGLTDGAIVASTTRFRRWTTLDGGEAHHLIDPRTGRPCTSGVTTVVVAAAEAWWAEALAKAALLAGPTDGRHLLDRHGVTSWIVESDSE